MFSGWPVVPVKPVEPVEIGKMSDFIFLRANGLTGNGQNPSKNHRGGSHTDA
jgi:hypothetical protein